MTIDLAPTRVDAVQQELDNARRRGPLQNITIPPCPELLTRLKVVMSVADPDFNEVSRIATSDVAMSAALLKTANSPLYASGQPVQTIGSAMDRLGLIKTSGVMSQFLAARAIRVNSPHLQRFWERATKWSQSMVFLAHKMPGISADLAQTYGLFCHVGLPVMMQGVRGYSGTLAEAQARIDRPFVATENANHRTDHAVVGALVTKLWRLSPLVTAAVRLHHDLDVLSSAGGADADVKTLIAAGLVAEHFMRRHEHLDPDAEWLAHGQSAMDWLHVQAQDMATWEDELREILDAV